MSDIYIHMLIAALFSITAAIYFPHSKFLAIIWQITSFMWMAIGLFACHA
jgi:hypothetical protein